MEAELRTLAIIVDEAGLRVMGIARDLAPGIEHQGWDGRPGLAGLRMVGLVAVAAAVRHPAQGPQIAHLNRQRPTTLWHHGRLERRLGERFPQCCNERLLSRPVEIGGQVSEPGYIVSFSRQSGPPWP